jgi:hypothetical protein
MASGRGRNIWWVRWVASATDGPTVREQGPLSKAEALKVAREIKNQQVWVERKDSALRCYESEAARICRTATVLTNPDPVGTDFSLSKSDSSAANVPQAPPAKGASWWRRFKRMRKPKFFLAFAQYVVIFVLSIQTYFLSKSINTQVNHLNLDVLNRPDEVNAAILQNMLVYPETRAYFYEGAEPEELMSESPDTRERVLIIAELFLDFMESFVNGYYKTVPEMDAKGSFRIAWEEYFVDVFSNSPVLCLEYHKNIEWYVNPDFPDYTVKCDIISRRDFED